MQTYLYDIYSQNVAGKSRKELSDLLSRESEQYNYALLIKDRLSLSKQDGISIPDALIDSIAAKSFIYVQQLAEHQYFLMVYANDAIIWVGRLAKDEIVGMLQLHLQTNPKTKLFIYNYRISADFTHKKIIEFKQDPLNKVNLEDYRLKQIFEVKHNLNKNIKFASAFLIVLVIGLIIGGLFLSHTAKERSAIAACEKAAAMDVWKNYRQEFNQPRAYVSIKDIVNKLQQISTIQNFAVKDFKCDGSNLQVNLSAFGGSVVDLEKWAVKNQYNLRIVSNTYKLSKSLDIQSQKSPFTIMAADDVLAHVIDAAGVLGKDVAVEVGDVAQSNNYKEINLSMNLQNQPVNFIQNLFKILQKYPVELVSIAGDYALNNFSGEVKLKIIGE
ncbi:MAG: hypothetical protein PVG30_04415 [Gammaproteobacteria bacterium]|jgi:hypothetical protein